MGYKSKNRVANYLCLVAILALALWNAGCSSSSSETRIPDADSVPAPSKEPGVVPDQSKMKRVPVD